MPETATATATPAPEPAVLPDDFNEYEAARRAEERGEAPPAKTSEAPAEPAKEPEEEPAAEPQSDAETAEESETEEDEQQEGEEEEVEPETGKEPTKEPGRKPKRGYQKKIDKLTRRVHELEGELHAQRERLVEPPAGTAAEKTGEEPKPAAAPAGKPKVEDFETYEEFTEALTDWKLEQRVQKLEKDRAEQERQREVKQAFSTQKQAWDGRLAESKAAHDDYDDRMADVSDVELPAHVDQAIFESENGPELAYHLAGHRDELERIVKLSPLSAVRELGRIEAQLKTPPKPAAGDKTRTPAVTPRVTSAPKPISPVGGAASGGTPSLNDAALASDFNAWEKQRRAQLKR